MGLQYLTTEATSHVHKKETISLGPESQGPNKPGPPLTGLPGGQCGEVGMWGGKRVGGNCVPWVVVQVPVLSVPE